MNAIDLLKNDHRRVSTLLERVINNLNPQTGQTNSQELEQIRLEIRFHRKVLEEYLYPELQTFEAMHASITLDVRSANKIDQLLAELRRNQPPEQSWAGRLNSLREAWQSHVEQSESRLLPEAHELLGETRLQQLFYDMDAIRTHQSGQDSAIYPASRLGPKT